MATILDQLEDLNDVIDAPNLEGVTIRDTLFGGVLKPGTFGDKLAAINYALTVYGVWYSSSLFEENGWTPPTTWAEAKELGATAKEQDKYLFCWGKEAATYYRTMAIESAIKEGGDEVRLAIENLEEGCWSHPAIQAVFTALKEIIDLGYMKPGGARHAVHPAQAQWSLDQEALLYPSGSWIENEMKEQTAEGFAMKGMPAFAVTADSAMPATALRAAAGEPFIVPSDGAPTSPAARSCCGSCCRRRRRPTSPRRSWRRRSSGAPSPRTGSARRRSCRRPTCSRPPARTSSTSLLRHVRHQPGRAAIWNSFLGGDMSVEDLTSRDAGDLRPGPRGRLDRQVPGGVTAATRTTRSRAAARRPGTAGPAGS